MTRPPTESHWPALWSELAQNCGIESGEPLLVALSGGADSTLLLSLAASARPRQRLVALHVDHGLRGPESHADAQACVTLCRELGVPLYVERLELDPRASDLEATARRARYAALARGARRAEVRTVATGHHADDALETLLMRWLRGGDLASLCGLKARAPLPDPSAAGLTVVRPLLTLDRTRVRRELEGARVRWREDSSNDDPRFTRNRVRGALLPQIDAACGSQAIDNLRAFSAAVSGLEHELDARTAHLAFEAAPWSVAGTSPELGGSLPRGALAKLATPLLRRTLWRLLSQTSGHAPSRALLDLICADLASGLSARHALPGGWSLQLRSRRVHLSPPERTACDQGTSRRAHQLAFPFHPADEGPTGLPLGLPGRVELPDGRGISAELISPPKGSAVPRSGLEVELEAEDLEGRGALHVRWPQPGDRFHGLGAPGSRPLSRFLADVGVPLSERSRVPLVFAGSELVWVAGIRPAETRRVGRRTSRRLHLVLHGVKEGPRAVCSEEEEGLYAEF